MKYFKFLFLFVILSFTACQKDINVNDQPINQESVIDKEFDDSEVEMRNAPDPTPCLSITQTGYDENGCCVYTVKLQKGVRYNGRNFSLNAGNGAIVTEILGQDLICWEVITCDSTVLTLISEANETSYIECSMTLNCTPEVNCCDAFCINVELKQELDEEGCFQIEITMHPRGCVGQFLFVLDNDIELLYDNIEVASSQKSIIIDLCNIFGVNDLDDFILDGTLFTENCGEIQIGPVAIFNGGTDPNICSQDS